MLGGRGECGHPAETGNILGSQVLAPEWGVQSAAPPSPRRRQERQPHPIPVWLEGGSSLPLFPSEGRRPSPPGAMVTGVATPSSTRPWFLFYSNQAAVMGLSPNLLPPQLLGGEVSQGHCELRKVASLCYLGPCARPPSDHRAPMRGQRSKLGRLPGRDCE